MGLGYSNEGPITGPAGEDLEADRLVRISASTFMYCDAAQEPVGITLNAVLNGAKVAVHPINAGGIAKVTGSKDIAAGAAIYPANDGKVSDSGGGRRLGTLWLDAITADGGKAAALVNIFSGTALEITYGDLLAAGSYQETHEVSDTQNYPIGTVREMRASDEIAVYSKSSGACWSGRGAKFILDMTDGIDFQLLNATSAVGAESVQFATGTHPAFAEDELKGGLLLISDQDSGDTQDKMVQQRVITGNDASLEDAVCTVYFSGGLTREVTNATYAFCMPNPYSSIAHDERDGLSVAGIPASYVSAANKYFWLKRRCKVWLAPQDAVGKTAHAREIVFRHDGSLDIHDDSIPTAEFQQHAGFIVDNNVAANGATFVQIDL